MLQRRRNMLVASIGIGRIKESQAAVVSIQQQLRKPLYPKRRLIRMMPNSNRPGPHGKPARLDSSAPERNRVGSRELSQRILVCESSQQIVLCEPGGSQSGSRANQEFAATHKVSCETNLSHDTLDA